MAKTEKTIKKNIVFLVEGRTEFTALRGLVSELYDEIDPEIEVHFQPLVEDKEEKGGDITCKYGVHPKNIEDMINKMFIMPLLPKAKLTKKDVIEVIQLVDLDGAYVEDDSIVPSEASDEREMPFYELESIVHDAPEKIIDRNKRKRENLENLINRETIKVVSKKVPYSVYYFSCNLDHFLFSDANISTGREKLEKADAFSNKYGNDLAGFVKTICSHPGSAMDLSYKESWDFIREGNNSLHPHSNFNLLIEKLAKEAGISIK